MKARTCSMLILAAVLLAPHAHANKKTEAARAFKKGKQLFKERSYIDAAASFEKAYRLRPHFFVQCSIARCYENMNDFIQAAARYRRCLDEGAAKAKMAERVHQSLDAVEKRVARLEIRSPGEGGTIFVDGKEAGAAPGTISLNPGHHAIEVRREGATPARASIESSSGGSMTITLVPQTLQIRTGETKLAKAIQAASQPQSQPTPAREGLHPAYFWTAAGVTALLGVAVTIFGVKAIGLRDEYEKDPTKQGYDDFTQSRMLTNVFVGLTAAAAATTTTLFFFTDFRGKSAEHDDEPGDEPDDEREDEPLAWGIGLRGSF